MIDERKPLILTASESPIDPEPGVYHCVPFEEYQSWNCFSKSMTDAALKTGAHLDFYIHGEKEKSKSLSFGSLVDTLVFEPDTYRDRYVMQPDTYKTKKTTGRAPNKKTETIIKPWNLNSKTCREKAKEIAASGKEIVTEETLRKAQAIRAALMSNAEAAVSITEGETQVSFVWVDEKTGVKCKGRADILGSEYIDDLKTARDASSQEFSRAIGNFGYHVQAAAYTEALKALEDRDLGFRFIVAETSEETETPAIALYELDSVSIVAGGLMFRRALSNVSDWLKSGVQGYSVFFEPIEAPAWLVNREINMSEEEVEL